MKVVIVSQYYAPEAVTIPADLAAGLTERGHSVRVVTGFPHYPVGRLFDGYRQRLVHVEHHGAVRVRRVPSIISHSANVLGRIANYVSFGLSVFTTGRYVAGADVVYVYATPMTAAIAPAYWRWIRGLPFVLHIQDVWPESITGSRLVGSGRLNTVIAAALGPWLRYLYRSAEATMAIAPTMSETLKRRGLPEPKSHTVFNWGNEPSDGVPRPAQTSPQQCTAMYAGNIGELQDLETVIRAAHMVGRDSGFRLVLCGTGVALARLRRLVTELDARNVEFWSPVGRDRLAEIYAQSDFQIVSLKDLSIFRGTVPSKLQTSLAFGVPVISTVRGDVESIVENNELGLTAPPEDPAALAAVFRRARRLTPDQRAVMAANARHFYYDTMSRASGVSRIEGILLEAAKSSLTKGAR